mmetsp:Transcript_3601/g.7464  ORF Transcript_3601/g.7464 Transcript_3601/m.7464 type:complete len:250 (-) Transcript_3601:357-1106(-)
MLIAIEASPLTSSFRKHLLVPFVDPEGKKGKKDTALLTACGLDRIIELVELTGSVEVANKCWATACQSRSYAAKRHKKGEGGAPQPFAHYVDNRLTGLRKRKLSTSASSCSSGTHSESPLKRARVRIDDGSGGGSSGGSSVPRVPLVPRVPEFPHGMSDPAAATKPDVPPGSDGDSSHDADAVLIDAFREAIFPDETPESFASGEGCANLMYENQAGGSAPYVAGQSELVDQVGRECEGGEMLRCEEGM